MLALDDGALARVVIGATRVPVHARGRWLREIAALEHRKVELALGGVLTDFARRWVQ